MNRAEMLQRLKNGEDPLELSILKWQDIVDGKGENLGSVNCALCKKFSGPHGTCKSCPVRKKTGYGSCWNTPYYDHHPEKELEFLKSLRKKETEK